jgi:type I restriction enzyme S subunit
MFEHPLPDGWRWGRLRDLLTFVGSGSTPKGGKKVYQSGGIPFIRSQNVYPDGLRLEDVAYVSPQIDSEMARTRLQPLDVLLNITGASIGRSTVVPATFGPGNVNQHVCILRPTPDVDPWFLSRFLNSSVGQDQIMTAQSGVTRQGLNYTQIRGMQIPLAALNEQVRINTRIDNLAAQSRTARAALERVPSLLKRFRQAVLVASFRGELTERDPNDEPAAVLLHARDKDANRAKHAEPLDTSRLPELPEKWCWTSTGEVIDLLQYGTSVKADSDAGSGIAVLRMGNIQEGRLDYENLKYIDPAKDDIPKYLLDKDDILINRTNSPELVGKAAIFEGETDCVFASYLIRLRAKPGIISPRYLTFVINSEVGRRHIAKVKHQVAGQANINSQNIRQMPIPLAPLEEQQRVVARIQSLFGQAETIERAVQVARRRSEKVDQAILARAFRGEL